MRFYKTNNISQNFSGIILCFCSVVMYFVDFRFYFCCFQKMTAKFQFCLNRFKILKLELGDSESSKKSILQFPYILFVFQFHKVDVSNESNFLYFNQWLDLKTIYFTFCQLF
jgi:hypothetical protein